MANLLYVKASPRGDRSYSGRVAEAFLTAYRETHPDDETVTLDVFTTHLPPFDGFALQAKYAVLHGADQSPEEVRAWEDVRRVAEEFRAADRYLFSVPMWNFGIPYRLKHYLDVLIQPGLTFSFSPETGYTGLVTGKPAVTIYARGGAYSGPEAAGMDFQKPYLDLALGFMGFRDVRPVVVEPTLAGGPGSADEALERAIAEAREAARAL